MKIDLTKGAYLQIGGELGRYNSIPIDVLVKLANDLQNLLFTIAEHDISSDEAIDVNNFKIELTGFYGGCAIPKFSYSQREENQSGHLWVKHRKIVNEKFEKLLEISNSGQYSQLKVIYPEPSKRNPIVENLYDFVNDFGNAPASFIDYDETKKKKKITQIYRINKFRPAAKVDLLADIKKKQEQPSEINEGFATVKITRRKGKEIHRIIDCYSKENISLEYAPEVIVSEIRVYHLNYPLRCLFAKEENYYVIQSEMLGIIGTGSTRQAAEESFSEEFDYIFQKYNSLEDSELTNNVRIVKSFLNHCVNHFEK